LTFEPLDYPSIYLHPARVDEGFLQQLGGVQQFALREVQTASAEVGVSWVLSAKGKGEFAGGRDITFSLEKPVVRALVLRAHLARIGRLRQEVRGAPQFSYALACGSGSITYPADDGGPGQSFHHLVPPVVASEVTAEQITRGVRRHDDHDPQYWTLFCRASDGIAVALLGFDQMLDVGRTMSLIGQPLKWCIFGQKLKDGSQQWTLLNPLHVWVEPPAAQAAPGRESKGVRARPN
jgi:hypothetical protein